MDNQYLPYLVCPDAPQQSLVFDAQKSSLESADGRFSYAIQQNVPILLPTNAMEKEMSLKDAELSLKYIEHYNKDAEHYDYFAAYLGEYAHEQRRLQETIISHVSKDSKHILDVGCGRAWVAKHFTQKKVAVCSMDISPINTVRALQQYPSEYHWAVVADAFQLPFKEHSFDSIITSEVIEHVPDPKLFITSLLKVLKPNGTLIITTPYKEKIQHSLCIHCNQSTPHHAHLHSFDEDKLTAIAKEAGAASVEYEVFLEKALILLRTHKLWKNLPFGLWKMIDKTTSKMAKHPSRILLKIKKK